MAAGRYKKTVFVDCCSAFNTAPRSKILDRLSNLGAPSCIVRWLFSYFTNRGQQECLNGQCSSCLYNNVGVQQKGVLSPFLFSLHSDSLLSYHSKLLKYVDHFVLCNSYSKCSDQEVLDDDLHRLVTWSADHGPLINKTGQQYMWQIERARLLYELPSTKCSAYFSNLQTMDVRYP